ncbi:MAG TPA: DNA ligase D [Casimicrobiaceae bacterium]|nr:DNA ligase D [Casimicrobiaceae bacterium]
MALDLYRKKRDFAKTPEPAGRVGRGKAKALSFVIQKHAASHLHYDFRLELDGVLLSWAVPKGPSLDPKDKRLAMHVEDHPLEYGDFEGIIPPKQYGAGAVIVWDRGHWIPKEDPREGYRKGKLKFLLDGEKLHGGWILVRSHGRYGGRDDGKAWLLMKEDDSEARTGDEALIVERAPKSVITQRDLDDVAREKSRVWHSTKSVKANVESGAVAPLTKDVDERALVGARKAALPETLNAQLATLVDEAPDGPEWLHEIKFDGYRMLGRIERGKCRIYSRNGKEWTDAFRTLAKAAATLPLKSAWIDGEIVVQSANGASSFQDLQNALGDGGEDRLVWFVFDLPFLNGQDLRAVPLIERKRLLEPLLAGSDRMRYSNHFVASGSAMLTEACKLGLEGIISKRSDSRYQSTRGRSWLKIKCNQRQEFVIGGFTKGQGNRSGFGALLVGYYDGDQLKYAGKVGTGFNHASLDDIRKRLDANMASKPPFVNPPTGAEGRRATWVKPVLVGEIAFTEWTRDDTLRHPSFQGLRLDKKAREVVRERPTAVANAEPPAKTSKASKPSQSLVAGVTISNPDKPMFPEIPLTKRELAEYYERTAERMLPHVAKRPLSLVRCPNGWSSKCFFQKHAKDVPEWIDRVRVQDSAGPADYTMANNVKSLVTFAQMGVIEIHPWGSREGSLEKPDRLILDLDPDDALGWEEIKTAALLSRTLLGDLGLESFLKTTGGKGLHVVVPIAATMDWDAAKDFVRNLALVLVRTFPDRFTATVAKAARGGKIFIDYLRNAHGATAIAPYSVRSRRNAPVAMPVDWSVLDNDEDIRFDHFNVRNVDALLRKPDPWRNIGKVKQSVTAALRKRMTR